MRIIPQATPAAALVRANDHLQHVITTSPYPMSHRTTMPMEGSRRVEGTLGADIYAIGP